VQSQTLAASRDYKVESACGAFGKISFFPQLELRRPFADPWEEPAVYTIYTCMNPAFVQFHQRRCNSVGEAKEGTGEAET
jgi:hypothetical protein